MKGKWESKGGITSHKVAGGVGEQAVLLGAHGALTQPLLVLGVQVGQVVEADAALLAAAARAHAPHARLRAGRQVDEAVRHQPLQLRHHRVEPACACSDHQPSDDCSIAGRKTTSNKDVGKVIGPCSCDTTCMRISRSSAV